MALPEFTMRQLLEAGVHFGHQTHRWNPRMGSFIYGERNGVHIMDLTQTVPLLHSALVAVRDQVAKGGRILFVGTKRQAQTPVSEAAERCAQYYMNHRWLGGTLTNWTTVSKSISQLKSLESEFGGEQTGYTKREMLSRQRVDFPIPGNDDASRAIALYCDLIAAAALDGISQAQGSSGIDIGAMDEPMAEAAPAAE